MREQDEPRALQSDVSMPLHSVHSTAMAVWEVTCSSDIDTRAGGTVINSFQHEYLSAVHPLSERLVAFSVLAPTP
jgi:hypothetical protein